MSKKGISAALLAAALAVPSVASAQEKQEEKQRTLAGHTFTYPAYSDPAFNASYFGFSQGIAFTKISNLQEKGTRLTLLSLEEKVEMGVQLWKQLGLYTSAAGDIVTAFHHGEFLYFFGQDAAYFDGGVAVIPYQNQWGTQIGIRSGFELNYSNMLLFDSSTLTLDFDIIEKLNNEAFSDSYTKAYGLGGSLNVAQAFGEHVSLQTSSKVMRGRKITLADVAGAPDLEITYTRFGFGAALSTDFNPYVPLALQMEYKLNLLTDNPKLHYLGGGIYFTKEKDLTVGVNAGKQFVDHQNSIRNQILVRKYF